MGLIKNLLGIREKPDFPAAVGVRAWIDMRIFLSKESHEDFFAREHELLLGDERIKFLWVDTNRWRVEIETNILYGYVKAEGIWYKINLGRYLICLRNVYERGVEKFSVSCIESGRSDGTLALLYSGEVGGYCFGANSSQDVGRNSFVTTLVQSGELYTLFTTVLDALQHINPAEQDTGRRNALTKHCKEVVNTPPAGISP